MIDEKVVVREDIPDPFQARLDYSACNADDLAALAADVLPDED